MFAEIAVKLSSSFNHSFELRDQGDVFFIGPSTTHEFCHIIVETDLVEAMHGTADNEL